MQRTIGDRLLILVTAVPGVYSLIAFLTARRVSVNGSSMEPALSSGERVLVDTLAYRLRRPRRGDIVLAQHPSRPGLRMIKRVEARPGDQVPGDVGDCKPRTLEKGQYYLTGDNPHASTDSRQIGFFHRRDIHGRAYLVYWPANRLRSLKRR